MADQLEFLRLFDLDADPDSSQSETAESSRSETPPITSRFETVLQDVPRENLLDAIADAAKMVAEADRELGDAIGAARVGCCSWREIGIAAGVPYQTLHRRHHQGEEGR